MKEIFGISLVRKGVQGHSGFTLIEVLVAISILTIGLLGVASMQASGIRGNYVSDSTTTSLCLAEDKMEDLMGRAFDDPSLDLVDTTVGNPLNSITNVDHEENVDADGQVGAGGRFHRIWNIDDSTNPTMKIVTVIVCYDYDKHRVSLTSHLLPQ